MTTRRVFVLGSLAAPLAQVSDAQTASNGKMLLSIHQNTSRAAGYRGSLEGWAKAGIRYVELNDRVLDEFLENDTLPAARRVLSDLGLTPVSAAANLPDIWIRGPARAASLEMWKKRCEQYSALGLQKIYCASGTRRPVTAEDFAETPESARSERSPRNSISRQ